MGKITSIYLTDEEATKLKRFCDENQCTQYSALKTAVRELVTKPIKEEASSTTTETETDKEPEKDKQTQETLANVRCVD
jgi:hypothetical protein